ncbi:oxidoreductase [Sphaerisporangium rufum]|uniref:Oxidoreductase n=1 Tax=Sphaerisporangium rufum TaxID=1381558 RepID=A0A919R139_9ACTN|nr:Gfo/Idh/MocA family oxidoreductase [Sphaerisporangium rufum]GII77826.1 oxidoreductase [Sphaerisporangium rufum]
MTDTAPPVRLGLACTGWIADWAIHRPIRDGSPAVVAFAASRDAARARRYARAWSVPAAGGWADLLARDDVDAVYLATPNATHLPLALDAVRAGKHVLCEKPLGRDPALVAALLAEARRRRVIVREAFHYRAHPAVAAALAAVRDGAVGAVRRIDVRFGWRLERPGDIRLSAALDGGAVMDVGCYGVDLVRHLTAAPVEVTGARAEIGRTGVDLTGVVALRSGPVRARLWASLRAAGPVCAARVTGSRGTLGLRAPFLPVLPGGAAPVRRFAARWSPRAGAPDPVPGSDTSYRYQLDAFARDVAAGRWEADDGITDRARALAQVRARITGER